VTTVNNRRDQGIPLRPRGRYAFGLWASKERPLPSPNIFSQERKTTPAETWEEAFLADRQRFFEKFADEGGHHEGGSAIGRDWIEFSHDHEEESIFWSKHLPRSRAQQDQ